jgi:hypothetical protein
VAREVLMLQNGFLEVAYQNEGTISTIVYQVNEGVFIHQEC